MNGTPGTNESHNPMTTSSKLKGADSISRKKRQEDKHSRMLARQQLREEHRQDLSLSDLGQIARLVGNSTLGRIVYEAVK